MPRGNSSRYTYGKIFKRRGKWYRYRYTDKKKSSKKLVRYTRRRDR